jgi:hypothetical protein
MWHAVSPMHAQPSNLCIHPVKRASCVESLTGFLGSYHSPKLRIKMSSGAARLCCSRGHTGDDQRVSPLEGCSAKVSAHRTCGDHHVCGTHMSCKAVLSGINLKPLRCGIYGFMVVTVHVTQEEDCHTACCMYYYSNPVPSCICCLQPLW